MNHEQLGSPAELARGLTTHLAAFAVEDAPIPDEAVLHALVDATFFASMHEEEARRLQFGVAWQPNRCECAALVALDPPVRVTPSNPAKLAAGDRGRRDLDRRPPRRGPPGRLGPADGTLATQPQLTIRVLAPGVLRIEYAGIPRALCPRRDPVPGNPHVVKSPALRLTRTFAAWRDGRSSDDGHRSARRDRHAARHRALAHGHGGMILVIPAEVSTPTGMHIHYAVTDGSRLLADRYSSLLRDLGERAHRIARIAGSRPRTFAGQISVRDEDQIAFDEAVDVIARLTAIDNALLVDTDLRVRGFGVQVIESAMPGTAFQHVSPYTDDVHTDDLATFKGTRHPAGVLFCIRQHGEAAAIIASQDANLSLAVTDASGSVEVLGSYIRAFGWK
ncbi:MAG: putative sensor domain DACNV-containing protein [Kofleriaceae bacterium]